MSVFRSFYDIAGWISSLERRVSALERMEELTVVAKYRTDAGQSISDSTVTIIDFEDQDYDNHSAVTTGAAWKFTAPINGYYHVTSVITYATTTTWAESEYASLILYIDGAAETTIGRVTGQDFSGTTQFKSIRGSDTVYLNSGQYIDIRTSHNSGAALALYNNSQFNYVTIERVG